MNSKWETVKLGEVARQNVDRFNVDPGESYVNLGVKWYAEGVFSRQPKLGTEMKAKTLYRVNARQFIYNRMFATEGSFAVVETSHAHGVVSNEFPVFDIDQTRLLPEYLVLHFQQPSVWAGVAVQCVGTTMSRSRWKEDLFLQYTLSLPPLAEQQRIVDLVGALDDTIEAARSASEASDDLMDSHLFRYQDADDSVPVKDLAEIQVGYGFKSKDFTDEGTRLLRGDNVTPGRIRWTDAKFVDESKLTAKERSYALLEGDIVVAMDRPVISTGTKVFEIAAEDLPALLVQRVARIRVEESNQRAAVLMSLKSPQFADYLRSNQTGAHVPHISQSIIANFPIPKLLFTPVNVNAASAMDSYHRRSEELAISLRSLRSELLTSLLSAAHEIPETYDEVLSAS